jgi:hypothetical protein
MPQTFTKREFRHIWVQRAGKLADPRGLSAVKSCLAVD